MAAIAFYLDFHPAIGLQAGNQSSTAAVVGAVVYRLALTRTNSAELRGRQTLANQILTYSLRTLLRQILIIGI